MTLAYLNLDPLGDVACKSDKAGYFALGHGLAGDRKFKPPLALLQRQHITPAARKTAHIGLVQGQHDHATRRCRKQFRHQSADQVGRRHRQKIGPWRVIVKDATFQINLEQEVGNRVKYGLQAVCAVGRRLHNTLAQTSTQEVQGTLDQLKSIDLHAPILTCRRGGPACARLGIRLKRPSVPLYRQPACQTGALFRGRPRSFPPHWHHRVSAPSALPKKRDS